MGLKIFEVIYTIIPGKIPNLFECWKETSFRSNFRPNFWGNLFIFLFIYAACWYMLVQNDQVNNDKKNNIWRLFNTNWQISSIFSLLRIFLLTNPVTTTLWPVRTFAPWIQKLYNVLRAQKQNPWWWFIYTKMRDPLKSITNITKAINNTNLLIYDKM